MPTYLSKIIAAIKSASLATKIVAITATVALVGVGVIVADFSSRQANEPQQTARDVQDLGDENNNGDNADSKDEKSVEILATIQANLVEMEKSSDIEYIKYEKILRFMIEELESMPTYVRSSANIASLLDKYTDKLVIAYSTEVNKAYDNKKFTEIQYFVSSGKNFLQRNNLSMVAFDRELGYYLTVVAQPLTALNTFYSKNGGNINRITSTVELNDGTKLNDGLRFRFLYFNSNEYSDTYLVDGNYSRIEGRFGLYESHKSTTAKCTFSLAGDGKVLGTWTVGSGSRSIEVQANLKNIKELKVAFKSNGEDHVVCGFGNTLLIPAKK